MKIAVNTRLLLPGRLDGIGWFTFESFRRICQAHPEHEFHFFSDRKIAKEFIFAENVIAHAILPPARRPFLFTLWYDVAVPVMLRKIGADVFVSPDAMASLTTSLPQLLVMHDLNFEHYPEDMPGMYSRYLRKKSPLFAKKATRIATVSEFSKADIITQYNVPPGKIDVIYNGVNEKFQPIGSTEKAAVKMKFTNGADYFVFVSSIHPRKNLQRLLPAFEIFKERSGSNVKLVVIGQKFWLNEELEQIHANMKHKDDVLFIGRLAADELHKVVAASLASAYVSYFEGFGIPIIEAFKCGVPVITSDVTSMPEVAGDAALLVNPFETGEIADALFLLWTDENLRLSLIEKGLRRAEKFSWQHTSEQLWKSIEKTL